MEISQHTQIKAIRCLNGKDVDTSCTLMTESRNTPMHSPYTYGTVASGLPESLC